MQRGSADNFVVIKSYFIVPNDLRAPAKYGKTCG